jgi:hypothetical protein
MKAKELRIGNYYNNNGEIKQITPNDILQVWESERIWCKSIPLTEEWLVKFGFKHFADGQYEKIFENLDFNWDKECGLYIFLRTQEDTIEASHIKHVHQLENLYFALTNQELTIKK